MSKILMAFETWSGATRGVAEEIARVLSNDGADVKVVRARDVERIEDYDAVIIGASVHAGQIPRPLKRLVKQNADALAKKPLAYFVVCFTMNEDTPENRETARGYLKPLEEAAPDAKPVDVGLFAGAALDEGEDYRRLLPPLKLPVKAMSKSVGDRRDWEAIRTWAAQLGPKLGTTTRD